MGTQGQMADSALFERSGFVRVAEGACLSLHRPGAGCTACSQICPVDAITVSERRLAISAEACTGCGQCAAACPTGALTATGFPNFGALTGAVLECARVPHASRMAGAIEVPCFGGLAEHQLLEAAASGGVTIVDRRQCAQCALGGSDAPWESAVQRATKSLESVASDIEAVVTVVTSPISSDLLLPIPNLRSNAPAPLSRRALFRRVIAPPRPKAPIIVDQRDCLPRPVAAPGLASRLAALQTLHAEAPVSASAFPMVSVSDACCSNGLCSRVCPTGALDLAENDGQQVLGFDAALCLACGDCAAICPSGAMTCSPEGEGLYAGRIVVRRADQAVCPICEVCFTPDSSAHERCPSCRVDRDLAALGHALMRRPRPPDLEV